MDPRIRTFLMVARLGQLTQASRRLNLSASSVSAQIHALERDIGVVLFTRSGRGMDLTAGGKIFFTAALQIEQHWMSAVREARAESHGERRLNIAASHTVAELFLPRPLGWFRYHWPATRVKVLIANSKSVSELVGQGTVDIGIVEGASVQPSLHHERLWQDDLTLIVSSEHPLAKAGVASVDDLAELDWILREEGSGTRQVFERGLEHIGMSLSELNVMMELASLRAITAMVSNNVGVSVVSQTVFSAPEVQVIGVVPVAIRDLTFPRVIEAITPGPHYSQEVASLLNDMRTDVRLRTRNAQSNAPDSPLPVPPQ